MAPTEVARGMSSIWWIYLLRGLVTAAFGLFALMTPTATLTLLVRLIGGLLLLDGAAGILGSMRTKDRGANLYTTLIGVGAGLILLFWPEATARAAVILFGAWVGIFAIGLLYLSRNSGAGGRRNTTLMAGGSIVLLIGVALMLWPGSATVAFSWMFGLCALLLAGVFLFLSIRFRQAAQQQG